MKKLSLMRPVTLFDMQYIQFCYMNIVFRLRTQSFGSTQINQMICINFILWRTQSNCNYMLWYCGNLWLLFYYY